MYPHELKEIATNESLKSQILPLVELVRQTQAELRQLREALGKAQVIQADPSFYNPRQFGAEIGMKERTVQKWCAEGRIEAIQPYEGGPWRIPASELERIISENSISMRPKPAFVITE